MQSIRARLLAFSALWTVVALAAAWVFISALLTDFVTRRFTTELDSIAEAVMAGAEWQGANFTVGFRNDTRFRAPLSGWYWQVSDAEGVLEKSESLWTADLGPDGTLAGPDGAATFTRAAGFTAPGDGRKLRVTVAMPAALLRSEAAQVTRPLAAALAGLGAVLVAASVLTVTGGLSALDRMRDGLEEVRAGRADRLPLPRSTELRPIAEETNRLIDENRQIIARARAHVGNLAHALKTPLSALANADRPQPELVARMDRIIRWHLKRARAAGHGRSLGQTAQVGAVLDDLAQVLEREAEARGLALTFDLPPLTFAGEREDLEEMLGNILENAVKWAASRIAVTGEAAGDRIALTIADDGPGIPEAERPAVLERGARLDETVQGSGLGLAIVADLVQVYGGAMRLGESAGGGLSVRLELPSARHS